jgi:hypothetical protein
MMKLKNVSVGWRRWRDLSYLAFSSLEHIPRAHLILHHEAVTRIFIAMRSFMTTSLPVITWQMFATLILLCGITSGSFAQNNPALSTHTRSIRDSFSGSQPPSSANPEQAHFDSTNAESLDSTLAGTSIDNSGEAIGTDSTVVDSSLAEIVILPPIVPPDTTGPRPYSISSFRLVNREFQRHGYKDGIEVITVAPGLYPRQTELYGQPAYAIPAGGSARDLTVMFRGRPFNEPVTGATNFTTFEPEEIQIAEYQPASVAGIASSGPMIRLIQPYVYGTVPRTQIIYRQGWYGLGRADWRIAHQISNEYAYHVGVNVSEFQGRFTNTYANTSHLRIGGRRTLRNIGQLSIQWMEMRDRTGRPYDLGTNSLHRQDVDISLSSGTPGDSLYRELALWYVRSESAYRYGSEDGNRLGIRFEQGYGDLHGHNLSERIDVERIAARFVRRPNDPDPQADRLTAGISFTDLTSLGKINLEGAIRGEYSTLNVVPDTASVDDDFLIGGSVAASYSLMDSLQLLGLASSSWRYPSLDESAGFWSVRTPDRWMDVLSVPDFTNFSLGNVSLKPVKTEYLGTGLQKTWSDFRQLRLMSGMRQWRDQIIAYQSEADTWTRRNVDTYSSLETTAYVWAPVYGPVTLAGSFTYAEPITATAPVPDTYGWVSARFMDHYYMGQLRIRATATAYYWGEYQTSDYAQDAVWTYELLFNAKIFDFEAYYGTRNLLSTAYEFIPGYSNLHREEIWGVRWILFR